MKFKKNSPRITVKFINADNEEELFEIKDRHHMNIGEIFTDGVATSLIEQEFKNKKYVPKDILVMAIATFTYEE